MEGKLPVSERRILTTKCVANAWEKIKMETEMIKHRFLKCGLSNNLDGTEDHYLHINGIEGYTFPKEVSEFQTNESNDSDSGVDSDKNEFILTSDKGESSSNEDASESTDSD